VRSTTPKDYFEKTVLINMGSAAASAFIKCSSLPELGGRDFPRELALGAGVPGTLTRLQMTE
jgi:hypothetical protein